VSILFSLTYAVSVDPSSFVLDVNITTAPQQITLPLGGVVQVIIEWGDGAQDSSLTHSYASNGIYQIKINKNGAVAGPWLTVFGSAQCDLTEPLLPYSNIVSFGHLGIESLRAAFGASQANFGVPTVTDLSCLFENATLFNHSNIVSWDVSRVTNMTAMFRWASRFSQPIGSWDTSSVSSMAHMFALTGWFNETIDLWDVSRVTDMSYAFYVAIRFNRELNSWDVSSVKNMDHMFFSTDFNRDLNSWNVGMCAVNLVPRKSQTQMSCFEIGQVTSMESMFEQATRFNRPLSNWNVSGEKYEISLHRRFGV
jgi:hypothetical protein